MKILNSKIIGEKPKHFIIAHGLFGQLDNWNTLGKQYGDYFTTHLVDLRNHARSFHDEDTSHHAMAEDLRNYMIHHNIEKAHFMGHSMGGKVVMDLALNHPERIDKLLIADMAPKAYPPHHEEILSGLESVDFSQVELRSDVEDFLEPYIPSKSVRLFLMKNVKRKKDETYAFRFNLKALSRDYDNLVGNNLPEKEFQKPVLFLGGENSRYILPEDKEQILKYFPKATIDYVSNAGHWLHAENPKEFFDKTISFLKK